MTLTVAENIVLGDLPTSGPVVRWRSIRQTARDALHTLGLEIDVDAVAGDLTVAEQTMVEVACSPGAAARTVARSRSPAGRSGAAASTGRWRAACAA
ncbi:hypothetical protein [Actinoplanes regularis]|uniref:hypothetical protein n=1 Tax=Actinoplanes regularis TaxID=52697 RepID=UPI00255592BB|nr:hypothetical protein [Actinoplanes regularis]GLW28015.1 hypothetical protein Areg01_09550 [Actinoplanes regularis]